MSNKWGIKSEIQKITIVTILLYMASPVLAFENSEVGFLKLTEINASNLSVLPESVYVESKNGGVCNVAVLYNSSLHSIDYVKGSGQLGELYIGGLSPVTECDLSMDVGIDRSNPNSQFYFYTPTAYLMFQLDSSSNYKIYSLWTSDSGVVKASSFTVPSSAVTNNKIHISIRNYESNRTNVVKYNDSLYLVTPYRTFSSRSLPYPVMYPSTLFGEAYVPSGTITFHLYNLTQSIPRRVITPYGDKCMGFGLDYPRRAYVQNGTALMHTHGQTGTVWADVNYMDNDTVAFTKSLLDDGWELGIHFGPSLSASNTTTAYAIIDNETAIITAAYGRPPTSWCSLANNDNVTHASYAYSRHGMYWRNDVSGIGWISNVRNIHNGTYNWWSVTSTHGAIFPTFTHHIDITPAIRYSLDADKFKSFSDSYASKNIKMCGFTEYYKRGIAQNETLINISESDSSHLKFTVDTNGYSCNVNVLTGFSSPKVYRDGHEIPSKMFDGGIAFFVQEDAEYVVSSSETATTTGS